MLKLAPRIVSGMILLALGSFLATRSASAAGVGENLLRNGSFEGALLYWHNVRPDQHRLIRGEAKVGEYALRIEEGYVASAPFIAERGEVYTVSFWARGDKPTEVTAQMPPSAREVGQQAKRLWTREATQRAEVGVQWQRVSFTWPADVPPSGFWPNPHYMIHIGAKSPVLIDGVTVTKGAAGTPDYLPRREVEVVADCENLPGYEGAKGNLFARDATAIMTAYASNPGREPRAVTLRWQLFDYEGAAPVAEAIDKPVDIAADTTESLTVPLKLTSTGTVIARLSVIWGEGDDATIIDSSDFPLSSLPYPKAATRPDWRERFGGSFAGGIGCVEKFQRLGFGWIRWRPHANGRDHLPVKPEAENDWQWKWFDQELDEQESHGCSAHICLYHPPEWIMEKGHPLPTDMRWDADDPRWDDLSIETVWDKFVKSVVDHYRGRSVIFEIENEPEFDKWDQHGLLSVYAKFTIRTARLIRQTNAQAKIMVNNVYGIPSRVNAALFKAGGLKYIDVISWHDYHAGWLADGTSLRRMRQNLDEAGGQHVEIWFNEGWAFTNTLVDEPIACTRLTSASSCNAIMDSVAELSVHGQKKTILFHTAYETHGMSFWDYSGPGTMLWDWYNYPLPLAPAWNVMAHHIGISDEVGFVRPPGANFCIFQDLRNQRGVVIAYADRDAESDVTVRLPDFGAPLIAEDIMGNSAPADSALVLSHTGRPVILYSPAKTPGEALLAQLEPLDRKHASFVSTDSNGEAQAWSLPTTWEGREKGSSEGSVAMIGDRPVWKLEQVWPADWKREENFRPMVWTGTNWNVKEGGFGGQPQASLDGRSLSFGTRAPHGTPRARRVAGLTFVAPQDGLYRLKGSADCRIWDGKNTTVLRLLKRSAGDIQQVDAINVPHQQSSSLETFSIQLAAGEQFTLVPEIEGMFAGGTCKLNDLQVVLGPPLDKPRQVYRLPAAWEGKTKGSAEGNPIYAKGQPIWRIDRVYPADPIYAENYQPLPWDGTAWHADDHQQGGQPKVRIEDGSARISVAGPWKNYEFQKIAGVAFLAPHDGAYRVQALANTKPWTGGAKVFQLGIFKKDTQRAVEIQKVSLTRDGEPISLDFQVQLTKGHELVFLPLMPDWNNATTTTISHLTIQAIP